MPAAVEFEAVATPPRIPLNDLGRMSLEERSAIEAAALRVIASGWYVMGPEHDAFERELAEYVGVEHAVGLGNGTDALELGLGALGVGVGDHVLTVANAGAYATTAVRLLGATPVYAEVHPVDLLLSRATLEAALSRLAGEDILPKALVVTHLFGQVVEMAPILEIANARGIAVLEDCAQALGATGADGVKAGAYGDIATMSFYPTKNLGAIGDGGAIVTRDPDLAEVVRRRRQYGWVAKYRVGDERGRNSRLDELQAAVLRARLPLLDAHNARRREIHAAYEAVTDAMVTTVARPYIGHLAVGAWDERERVRETFAAAGIVTDVHYPVPDHLQAFPSPPETVRLPVTERAAERILSLPIFPGLRDDEVERVVAVLAEVSG